MGPTSAELGLAGERLAARLLARRGMVLLGRRVRTRAGEVDLVFQDGDTLVCVEVKCASADPGGRWSPGERFDARALERVSAAARELARRGLGRGRARVDLVELWIGRRGAPRWRHHVDVGRGARDGR